MVRAALDQGGWFRLADSKTEQDKWVKEDAEGMREVAAFFKVGDILEKRGKSHWCGAGLATTSSRRCRHEPRTLPGGAPRPHRMRETVDRLLTGEDHDRNNGQPPHQQVHTFTQLVHTVEQYTEPGTGLIKFTDPNHYSAAIHNLARHDAQDFSGGDAGRPRESTTLPTCRLSPTAPALRGILRSGHNVVEFFPTSSATIRWRFSIEVAWEAQ